MLQKDIKVKSNNEKEIFNSKFSIKENLGLTSIKESPGLISTKENLESTPIKESPGLISIEGYCKIPSFIEKGMKDEGILQYPSLQYSFFHC